MKNSLKRLKYKTILPLTLSGIFALYACTSKEDKNNDSCLDISCLPRVTTIYQCNDHLDNDGDTLKDYPDDPGCSSATDNDEYNNPVNQAPVITSTPSLEILVHNGYTYDSINKIWRYNFNKYQYDVDAVDPDGDDLIYYLTESPNGMTIDSVTGLIESQLSFNELGKHNITVVADDGKATAEQSFLLDIKYPYVDDFGNTIDYDFVRGNDEMVLVCEKPCTFFDSYPVNLEGDVVTSDEDYFNKKFTGFNYGFDNLKDFILTTPEYSLKPIEAHIKLHGDSICSYDWPGYYFIRRRQQIDWLPPPQGVICITNSGQSGLDPLSLLDQITFTEEMTHANQYYRIPLFISPNFYESQARAITDVLLPDNWNPPLTGYCDDRLSSNYQHSKVFYDLCTQCVYDKDKESLFWNRVVANPAGYVYKLVQVYDEITICTQTDIENIFIDNKLYQCSDGWDNDNNGLFDYPEDFKCSSLTDESEFN